MNIKGSSYMRTSEYEDTPRRLITHARKSALGESLKLTHQTVSPGYLR